jgi:hypothetical protein
MIKFVPNNLERDTVIRVAGPEGQVGDSVSEVKPVETLGGEAVNEGSTDHGHHTVPNRLAAQRVWSPSTRSVRRVNTRTRNHEVITNTAGVAVAELSVGRAPRAPRCLRHCASAWLCPDQDDSTKEDRTS